MPKTKEIQNLLGEIESKTAILRHKIKRLDYKRKCPFWDVFDDEDSGVNACIYMLFDHKCKDFETCPGMSDAWCFKQIDSNLAINGEIGNITHFFRDFKKVLEKYADTCCDECDQNGEYKGLPIIDS